MAMSMSTPSLGGDPGPGTVARVASLLSCLADSGGHVTIKAVSQRIGLPPSTVHRLLHLLMEARFIEQAAGHGYRAGRELMRMATRIAARADVAELARPAMRRIVDACGEVCVLMRFMPETRQIMPVAYVDSPNPLRYSLQLFRPGSIAWGSTGRSVLAYLPEEEVAAVYAAGTPSPADGRALPPRYELEAELATIRRQGYAVSRSHRILGATGVAVPLRASSGRVLGSLCVTIPEIRFRSGSEAEIGALLTRGAAEIGAILPESAWEAAPVISVAGPAEPAK